MDYIFLERILLKTPKNDAILKKRDCLLFREQRGPLLPVGRFSGGVDEVVAFVRAVPTGKPLCAYVHAKDRVFVEGFRARVHSGMMAVNNSRIAWYRRRRSDWRAEMTSIAAPAMVNV